MFGLDADEPAWIRRSRIVRLRRCPTETPTYAVYIDFEPIGYVRRLHLQDWACETAEGETTAGFSSVRPAADRLVDLFDGIEPIPARQREGISAG